MAECYPTGCTPCTDEIQFPPNPKNGQEECFVIGTKPDGSPDQRCWVYDHCVPGWRAKGETAATVEFKGVVDICTQNPPTDAKSGDWWIVEKDCNNATQLEKWFGDDHPNEVLEGDRIAYSGTVWQVMPPAILAYASDALGDVQLDANGKPDPDERHGGIVKIASLSQAKAGTDKCDVITPYTLQGKLDDQFVDFNPTKPDPNGGVTVEIKQGSDYVQCISDTTLVLNAKGSATATDGSTAIGRWKYQWSENDVDLRNVRVETVSGGSTDTLTIEDFEITPATGTRTFKVTVTFTDLFGDETVVEESVNVTLANAVEITSQPAELDLSTNTTGTMSVTAGPVNADLPAPALTYKWFINGSEITGANEPDLGYTFADFTTDTLSVTRDDADAGSYSIYCEIEGGCNGLQTTDTVILKGPGGFKDSPDAPSFPGVGAVGSYTIIHGNTVIRDRNGNGFDGLANPNESNSRTYNPFRVRGGTAVYQKAGTYQDFATGQDLDDPPSQSVASFVLALRIE